MVRRGFQRIQDGHVWKKQGLISPSVGLVCPLTTSLMLRPPLLTTTRLGFVMSVGCWIKTADRSLQHL
eukprot:9499456-Pyramimonas_sp.AAC.1